MHPTHYTLDLRPDIANFNFSGDVQIEINVLQPTLCILLHAEDLLVRDISLANDMLAPISVHSVMQDNVTNVMKIGLQEKLRVGRNYVLKMSFSGEIRNDLRGFYRSHYVSADGREQWIASTQFEPISARAAFPCFDEPRFKSEYTISITLPPSDKNKTVLSNMPESGRETLPDGFTRVQFERSVKMSSYLVAYIIGFFDYVEATSTAGSKSILYRVYTMPRESESAQFALQVAQNVTRVCCRQ